MKRRSALIVSTLGLTLTLAGCSSSGVSYSILDREADAADELPAAVLATTDEIDGSTSQLAGEYDGSTFWLASAVRPDTVCLVVYPNEDDWVATCGAEGGPIGVGGPSGNYILGPDGMPAPEDATQVADNVYVVGR